MGSLYSHTLLPENPSAPYGLEMRYDAHPSLVVSPLAFDAPLDWNQFLYPLPDSDNPKALLSPLDRGDPHYPTPVL